MPNCPLNAWAGISERHTYTHAKPTTTSMSGCQTFWTEFEKSISSKDAEVYEQLVPGDQVRRDKNHVVIRGGGSVEDKDIPELKRKAELAENLGLDTESEGVSKALMCAVDALYKLDGGLVKELNTYLDDSDFGPFEHVSSAVYKLLNLRKKARHNSNAALAVIQLEGRLDAFAAQYGLAFTAFLEWPQLMDMKGLRDRFSHPFNKAFLVQELEARNQDLVPVENALRLLLREKCS